MINAGTFEVDVMNDGWTVVTKDRRLSAHFEHTVVVRDDKAEIVTGFSPVRLDAERRTDHS